MRRTPPWDKQFVTAGSGTGRFFKSLGWALTLAGLRRCLEDRRLLRLAPLTHPLSIPATLPAAARAPCLRLPPAPPGTPRTPTACRLPTGRTAIPRLRAAGLEELLAALQQAAAAPRPARRALPSTRSSIMLKRTQGSANSRRPSLGEEASSSPGHFMPAASSVGLPLLQINSLPARPPHTTDGHLPRWPAKWLNSRPPPTPQTTGKELQWGLRLSTEEGNMSATRKNRNGALQWGLRLSTEEGISLIVARLRAYLASMGPPSFNGGRAPAAY